MRGRSMLQLEADASILRPLPVRISPSYLILEPQPEATGLLQANAGGSSIVECP